MIRSISYITVLFLAFAWIGCTSEKPEEIASTALESITAEDLQKHIATLASDEFQGRMPFTEGEEKTIAYLKNTFQEMGLEPGNGDRRSGDSYFQEVPLVEINAIPDEMVTIEGNGQSLNIEYIKDYVALTRRVTDKVEINNSELVFAGFGIVAPEYDWNDYEGIDWKGKTAVVLVNDPGFGSDDSTFFKGNTMTYYGRWTYKY
jgi:hypothetical protein